MRRRNKLNLLELIKMKQNREPVVWITAYDFPFAYVSEQAGVDMILVGDSGGMVQLGHRTTNPVTMDEMIILSNAARRGAPDTFIVGDMPQGSYEVSDEAVKLEGGRRVATRVRAMTDAGILVIGHLGLTPQSATSFGGYRVQGKTLESFESTIEDSLALEESGAVALLLEAIPTEPAGQVALALAIPVLGIGAGNKLDGQLVIMHDVVGFYQAFRPLFAKCYIPQVASRFLDHVSKFPDIRQMGREERNDGLMMLTEMAVEEYVAEVREGLFPSSEYCYEIQPDDLDNLRRSKLWKEAGDPRRLTVPQSI